LIVLCFYLALKIIAATITNDFWKYALRNAGQLPFTLIYRKISEGSYIFYL